MHSSKPSVRLQCEVDYYFYKRSMSKFTGTWGQEKIEWKFNDTAGTIKLQVF